MVASEARFLAGDGAEATMIEVVRSVHRGNDIMGEIGVAIVLRYASYLGKDN
ncbi:hypothetical protein [Rhodoferax sp. U11-2br]|uniref:hypothetical protein n=1 Tax=Rhodoferax sp. U11-2br TaxID=2838878 RepID=UPI001BE68C9A|nr:hypothetical protein [Rhodoferax sp. U11-2br]MBT3066618.1 hypothetical protein [Rhodoferax sp. U11-2br]